MPCSALTAKKTNSWYEYKWKPTPWWHTDPDHVWIFFLSLLLVIWYDFALLQDNCCIFLVPHYMWFSPGMLYIQYVDMHLSSFLRHHWIEPFQRSVMEFLLDLRQNHFVLCPPNKPASTRAPVWMKVMWSPPRSPSLPSVGLFLVWRSPSENRTHMQTENRRYFLTVVSVCIYYSCMNSWMFRSYCPEVNAKQTGITGSVAPAPTLLLSVNSPGGWVDAQSLPQSLQCTDSRSHARQTPGWFLPPAPPKKGLTVLFTLPIKHCRSFM